MSHLIIALTKNAVRTPIEPDIDHVIAPRLRMNRRPDRKADSLGTGSVQQSKTDEIPSGAHEMDPICGVDAIPQ